MGNDSSILVGKPYHVGSLGLDGRVKWIWILRNWIRLR